MSKQTLWAVVAVAVVVVAGLLVYGYYKAAPGSETAAVPAAAPRPAEDCTYKPHGGGATAVVTSTVSAGEGAGACYGDSLSILYIGTLKDGTVFDATRNNAPFTFALGGQVIPGFQDGLFGMKTGEVRKIVIPPELGYGSRSVGRIPPNSELTFTVKLLNISR